MFVLPGRGRPGALTATAWKVLDIFVAFDQSPGVESELPLNDDRRELKPGTKAWKQREVARYRKALLERDGLYPPYMAAWILGVSRQRVYQLFELGVLERLEFFGHTVAPGDELEALVSMEKERRNPAFRLTKKTA